MKMAMDRPSDPKNRVDGWKMLYHGILEMAKRGR